MPFSDKLNPLNIIDSIWHFESQIFLWIFLSLTIILALYIGTLIIRYWADDL